MLATRISRAWIPFANSPNHVVQKQKLFQDRFNHHVPVHLIPPRSRVYYTTYLIFFTAGLTGSLYTAFELVVGKQTTAD
ncbi:hypothetical protein CALVIDRAFT_562375 [Calocera viscosa TUFC12733]|uniref:Uncharacterized protein n=1 Tax=Calocera viscosa (strain TUFC12733) TaxID=1330018 RepID=A0A167NR65_CALVF|nr:hypothetical protein CALVIDRAFT_562375 [Calocera viscosa TUFC12733]